MNIQVPPAPLESDAKTHQKAYNLYDCRLFFIVASRQVISICIGSSVVLCRPFMGLRPDMPLHG